MWKILRHYWPEIRKYRLTVSAMALSRALEIGIELVIPFYLAAFANLIAVPFSESPEGVSSLLSIFSVIVFLYATSWLFWRITDYATIRFEIHSLKEIENRAFQEIEKQSYRFFQEMFSGSIVKKVNRFTNAFEMIIDRVIYNFLPDFIKMVVVFFIFYHKKPLLGSIFFVWVSVFLVGNYFATRWKLKFDLEAARADSRVGGVMADSLSNYAAVKAFAAEDRESERFQETTTDRTAKRKLSWMAEFKIFSFQGVISITFELLVFYLMIQWWREGTFTVGDLVFVQTYLTMLFRSLWEFGINLRRLIHSLADAQEMTEIFDLAKEVVDAPGAKPLLVSKGAVDFRNVSFSYEKEGEPLFHDFCLSLSPGEKIGLVGPSGGGKTTIVKILLRFFDLQKGEIVIDGQKITEVTQSSLRENISLVSQHPEIFHRTLKENIAFGKPDASDEAIIHSAKIANAHEFISNFPKGYDTVVGERGVKLSGGEKQRIALARAFLKNAPLIILDEATSALDSITEKFIQDSIKLLISGKTSIVIAHRLSTILQMDRIIVIDEGSIVEEGTHRELLKKKGFYAKLWEHQVGGFITDEASPLLPSDEEIDEVDLESLDEGISEGKNT